MLGIEDRNIRIKDDEWFFDASPTAKMNTARTRRHLSLVSGLAGQTAAGVLPAKRDTSVTIIDKSIAPTHSKKPVAVQPGWPESRPEVMVKTDNTSKVECPGHANYVSGATLLAAGACGLLVGILWGRKSK